MRHFANKGNVSRILPRATIILCFCTFLRGQRHQWIRHQPLGPRVSQRPRRAIKLEDVNLAKDRPRQFYREPSFHFSITFAALINRNAKIRLNGSIFSFAFGGHFSCSENFQSLTRHKGLPSEQSRLRTLVDRSRNSAAHVQQKGAAVLWFDP